MSPEAIARHEAETQAHRAKLKEQEERRKAFWIRLGGAKETMLYESSGENYTYTVSVAYGVSWDGLQATVDITIGGDGYPSRFDFSPASALRLMQRISRERKAVRFSAENDDYWHMDYNGNFSLNRKTVLNLLKWLRGEKVMLEELSREDLAH